MDIVLSEKVRLFVFGINTIDFSIISLKEGLFPPSRTPFTKVVSV